MRLGKYLSSLTKPELEELKELLNLTEEEEKVFTRVSKGHSVGKISSDLNMSERTVSRRIEEISLKIQKEDKNLKKEIPIADKFNLTIEEAAAYFNIGTDRIREITEEHKSEMVLMVGVKRLIKRKKMEEFLEKTMVL